ncbi:MAG: polysaccharide deacetylase family protein [Coriobacteriia bacterium]|nr:polysaccharide deacetylase family protein [Coriobacteriia bacterium]
MRRDSAWPRRIARGVVALAVCALGLAAFGFDYALRQGEVVKRGPATADAVALTFDDGPGPTYTPAILDILAAHEARATFFVIGEHVERHPDLVRRMIDEGHEVAQHSYTHPDLARLNPESVVEEFDSSADQMAERLVVEARSGDILLAHDGRLDRSMTVQALPTVLAGLGERNLAVVTLSELDKTR